MTDEAKLLSPSAFFLMIIFAAHGCKSIDTSEDVRFASEGTHYELDYVADDEKRGFVLNLKSTSSERMCISISDWPDQSGSVSGSRAKIIAGERVLVARPTNFGTCIGPKCSIALEAGSSLNGFVGYGEFGNADEIASIPEKKLEYEIAPYHCSN